jgi:hypothetical protein
VEFRGAHDWLGLRFYSMFSPYSTMCVRRAAAGSSSGQQDDSDAMESVWTAGMMVGVSNIWM